MANLILMLLRFVALARILVLSEGGATAGKLSTVVAMVRVGVHCKYVLAVTIVMMIVCAATKVGGVSLS